MSETYEYLLPAVLRTSVTKVHLQWSLTKYGQLKWWNTGGRQWALAPQPIQGVLRSKEKIKTLYDIQQQLPHMYVLFCLLS